MKKQLLIGLLALGMGFGAQAASLTGGISFDGSYMAQNSGGVTQSDLNNATQIAFGATKVSTGTGTSGSFTVIPDGTAVTMFSPLVFNPITIPGSALWTVSFGANTFTFNLSTLFAGPVSGVAGVAQSLTLSGSGTVKLNGTDATSGTWVATFNTAGTTFSWSASTGTNVPDGGMTIALLGLALLGLAGVRHSFQAKSLRS